MFRDREEAGQRLAERLGKYQGKAAVVVALPRGGVPVGREVADQLGLPLDVVVVRKVGAEFNPEYAIGAVSERGEVYWEEAERQRADAAYLERAVAKARAEASERLTLFRAGRPERDWSGQTAIVVDDGVATGLTMMAALQAVRSFGPDRVVAAVPVGPPETRRRLAALADEVVVLETPAFFNAVGAHYEEFPQVANEVVASILSQGV